MIQIQTELVDEHFNHKLDFSIDRDLWILYCWTCKVQVARGETEYDDDSEE